jgi:F-type H+-transporting ATPase subunit gamma
MPAATPLDIKRKIRSVQNTQQITKAMKMVAAARLRRAEIKMRAVRPYSEIMNEFLLQVLPSLTGEDSPLVGEREAKAVGLIVITSDRGLCGAFNANILRRAEAFMRQRPELDYRIFCLGKKGAYYFSRRRRDVRSEYTDLYRTASLPMTASIVGQAASSYISGGIDELQLVYSHFENLVVHPVVLRKLLPVDIEAIIGKIPHLADETREKVLFEFEPDLRFLSEILLEKYISRELYHGLLESFASELGARMTAMEAATDNAQEMVEALTLQYNNIRQAAITTEIVEIASTAEAMR